MATGLDDVTFDAGVCFAMRWGATKVPLLKFTPPKQDVKTEKPRRLGEMLATKQTVGVCELGNASCEMLLTDYSRFILPRMPKHGGTLIQIPITATLSHPSVTDSYSALYDAGRIVVLDGPEFSNDEKALVKKIEFSIMGVYEKGNDGVWKTLAQIRLPNSQLLALMQF